MDSSVYICIGTILLLLFAFMQRQLDRMRNYPPGPLRLPVIGSMLSIFWYDMEFPAAAFAKMSQIYGPVFFVQVGMVKGVAVNGYAAVKEYLTNDENLGRVDHKWTQDRSFGKPIGLAFSSIENWRETRRFSARVLRDFGFGKKMTMDGLITQEFQEVCDYMRSKAEDNEGILDTKHIFDIAALNVTWALATGQRYAHNDPKLLRFVGLIDEYFRSISFGSGLLAGYPFLVDVFPKLVNFDKQQKINREIQAYLVGLINEYRDRDVFQTSPSNFIEVYLQKIVEVEKENSNHPIYSVETLATVLYDFFVASSETTSNTLSFALLYFILFPHIQQKLHDEIDFVIGSARLPSLDDRANMPYTQAMILEVNRFCCVEQIAPRKIFKPTKFNDYIAPGGLDVFVNMYSVSFDENEWGDPFNFRPERFLSIKNEIMNENRIFTFSTGKRNCIGETVGKAALFLGLVSLLQKFKFSLDPSMKGRPDIKPILGWTSAPKPFTLKVEMRPFGA